jgi:peroxiredoxin Q/BCP
MTLTQTLSAWTPRASRFVLPILAVVATLATPAAQAKAPEAGQPAPAFRLQDQTGEWRSLADYRGKIGRAHV